jgi:protein-S-isoprenylcysteine O-methyltransferase Ste14
MIPFWSLVALWLGGEIVATRLLSAAATGGGEDRDRRSFRVLWVTIALACFAGGWLGSAGVAAFPASFEPAAFFAGLGLLVIGLAVRWAAIFTLRRFFTVEVTIRDDHRLVSHGLYRFVRHPSYTGSLLSFLGFGVALGSFASVAVVMIPVGLAFLHRIRIEEAALAAALGDPYRDYAKRTKRLLPGIY